MVPSERQDGCGVVFQTRFPSIAPSACWNFWQIVTIRDKKKLTGENVIFRCGRGTAAINAFLVYRPFAHGYLDHTYETQQKAHLPQRGKRQVRQISRSDRSPRQGVSG